MAPDLWALYTLMKKSRLFEEAVSELWQDGLISGEMHLGTGEEAIVAGVVSQLQEGDAMALDHRATPPLIMRGVDPVLLLCEMLGFSDGLCHGWGGHMHLFSPQHLAASSGIVGSSGPAGTGFALAAQYQRPGTVAVAFFGEGALNQGMMMEALNLAVVWKLPLVFVCKDDSWSITAESQELTGGGLRERVLGFGLPYLQVDGRDVLRVWQAAGQALDRARSGEGPSFIHAGCVHLEGHFLGYQMLRVIRKPLQELPGMTWALTRSFLRPGGGSPGERLAGVKIVSEALVDTLRDPRRQAANDPLERARQVLDSDPLRREILDNRLALETAQHLLAAVEGGAR